MAATPEKTWRADGFPGGRATPARRPAWSRSSSARRPTTSRPFAAFRTLQGAPLGEIKTLLAGASLFVGNDSGPAHMAAAFGLPVVVIFGASDPGHLGPVAHRVGGGDGAGRHRQRASRPGDGRAGAPAGARMNELLRLLAYARRYWPHLAGSVVLMALAGRGAGHDRAADRADLRPRARSVHAADDPTPLFAHPGLQPPAFYLDQIVPLPHPQRVWTMVAFAIVAVFSPRACATTWAITWSTTSASPSVTDLRNAVFDKVLRQGAEFFEAHSTGRLMSSIMNDIDKVQLATSQILADLLRQIFSAAGAAVRGDQQRLEAGAGQPDGAAVRDAADHAHRPAHPPHQPRARRTARRELNQILQETLSGHMVVKAFGAEAIRIAALPRCRAPAAEDQPALRAAAGALLAADRNVGRRHHRGAARLTRATRSRRAR